MSKMSELAEEAMMKPDEIKTMYKLLADTKDLNDDHPSKIQANALKARYMIMLRHLEAKRIGDAEEDHLATVDEALKLLANFIHLIPDKSVAACFEMALLTVVMELKKKKNIEKTCDDETGNVT